MEIKNNEALMLPVDLFILNDTAYADREDALQMPAAGSLQVIVDQILPPNSPAVSKRHKELMQFARETGTAFSYGDAMTAQQLMRGLVKQDQLVVGMTYDVAAAGVVGALGVKLDEAAYAKAFQEGKLVLPPQKVKKILLQGKPANAKNAALSLAKALSEENLTDTILVLSAEDLTEAVKLQILLVLYRLGITGAYFTADLEEPDRTVTLQEEKLVVLPGSYRELLPLTVLSKTSVNAVFVGGAAGGSIEMLRILGKRLKGRKVAYGTRLIVAPASREDYVAAANEDIITAVFEAGGLVINQCGNPAVQGRIGENEVMVSNDTENSTGYAGFASSRIFITDTEAAAEAALSGYVGTAEESKVDESGESREIVLEGRIWKFGDDIDTDIIIPTQHLNYATMEEIRTHAFEPLRPEIAALFREGDMIVAGNNFGCGSSREQAAEVLLANGIHCVVAKSFARIFFRNAINNGVLLLECPELPDDVQEGDVIRVELNEQTITVKGKQYHINQVPENLYRIISDGGLVKNVEKQFKASEGGE